MDFGADALIVALKRMAMRLAMVRRFRGLWVGAGGPDKLEQLERTHAALAFIEAHDPRRLNRLLLDVERIFVDLLPAAQGSFRPDQRWCLLDQRFVMSASVEALASTVVHEATHARLHAVGIAHGAALTVRTEGVCMRRELAFSHRHPNGADVRAQIEIGLRMEPEDWSGPLMQELLDEAADQTARDAGVPLWVLRLARRHRNRGAKKRAAAT